MPDGFPRAKELRAESLSPAPAEWGDELQIRKIDGMPKVQEHALFHAPSRTLIVGDLLFNFGADASGWTRFIARYVMRLPSLTGMSAAFRFMIQDREAFQRSVLKILEWDFDRVIVGHGEKIETEGKRKLRIVLRRFGLSDAAN